jgi:hypothetical protein
MFYTNILCVVWSVRQVSYELRACSIVLKTQYLLWKSWQSVWTFCAKVLLSIGNVFVRKCSIYNVSYTFGACWKTGRCYALKILRNMCIWIYKNIINKYFILYKYCIVCYIICYTIFHYLIQYIMDILLCKSCVIIHIYMFSNYIMLFMSWEVIQPKNTVQPTFSNFWPRHLVWQMSANVRITLNFQKIFFAVMTAEEKY